MLGVYRQGREEGEERRYSGSVPQSLCRYLWRQLRTAPLYMHFFKKVEEHQYVQTHKLFLFRIHYVDVPPLFLIKQKEKRKRSEGEGEKESRV